MTAPARHQYFLAQLGEGMKEGAEDVVHLWAGILDVGLVPRVSANKPKFAL